MSSEKWKLNSCWYDMTWSIVACQYLYGCCSPPSNLSCKQMLSRSCRGSHSIFCQSLDRLEHSLHCGQDGCLVHPLPSWCSPKVLYQTRPSPHGFLSLSDLPAREGLHPVLLRTDAPLQSGWRPSGPSDSLLVNIYMSQNFLTSNLFLHTFILCILPGFLLSKVLVAIPIKCRPSRWTICYWRLRKFQKDEKEWNGMFAASIWAWPDNTCLVLLLPCLTEKGRLCCPDAAHVDSSLDLDVSLVSPARAPGVLHQPVVHTILCTEWSTLIGPDPSKHFALIGPNYCVALWWWWLETGLTVKDQNKERWWNYQQIIGKLQQQFPKVYLTFISFRILWNI